MSQYLLAIDAGTGSVRAVLFTPEGRQVAVSSYEWQHEGDGTPGAMNFAIERNWQATCNCIRQAISEAKVTGKDILAVSASSMREAIVLYDQQGKEIWACANVDARANGEVRYLREFHSTLEKDTYQNSGQTYALSALPRLLWLKEHEPETFNRIHRISMLSDWVLYRLSGNLASDPSNACTSGMLSLRSRTWSPLGLAELGLPTDIFPPVVEAGTNFGRVNAYAAELTGLSEGTPVVMGGGDVQLGCVGLGVVHPGETAILGGTFWQQEVNLPTPTTDPEMNIRVNCHAVPGVWQGETITFFVGSAMRWLRDVFGQDEKKRAELEGVDPYTLLEAGASVIPPGSYDVIPIFSDVMRYSAWYHAAPSFLNLSLDPARSGHHVLFRSMQENAAIVTAQNLFLIRAFTQIDSEVLTFAGGGSKGALWCQILSDVTGKPVRVPVVKEATALGTAIAAGTGISLYSSVAEGGHTLVRWDRTYEPKLENTALYERVALRWREAYQAQLGLVDRQITQSLWKAPGL